MLILFGGLPGVGKSSIARELARQTGAVAGDNLRIGRIAIADSVNPLRVTRDAWVEVARRAEVEAVEIEVTCSDGNEHRRRVETRIGDIPGSRPPTWGEVVAREYDPWNREHLVIDTAGRTVDQCVTQVRAALSAVRPRTEP